MSHVLYAAAVYNLVWGAAVILLPRTTLGWIGLGDALYPQLWQCLGMVIGVYGIGYGLAARRPATHWPIVLVGLLGKIFGPIGFAYGLFVTKDLPLQMGWTILTNDLIWWIPFTVILLEAAKRHQRPVIDTDSEFNSVHDALSETRVSDGRTLLEVSEAKPTMVIFLRHFGCTFCREAVSDVAAQKDEIESGNVQVVFVHMSTRANAMQMFARYGLENPLNVSDPNGRLYRAFALQRMSSWQMLSPRTWWRSR